MKVGGWVGLLGMVGGIMRWMKTEPEMGSDSA